MFSHQQLVLKTDSMAQELEDLGNSGLCEAFAFQFLPAHLHTVGANKSIINRRCFKVNILVKSKGLS